MTDVTIKEDAKKLLPRQSTRATPRNAIPGEPKTENQEDALAQVETTVEK